MNEILILFTRVPKVGTTKTRLYDFLTKEQAVKLQENLIKDLYTKLKSWNVDVRVYHSGNKTDDNFMRTLIPVEKFYYQTGETLGDKMYNAINEVLTQNPNSKIVLIGTDILNISEEIIKTAFTNLNSSDVVINPTYDGGYYLVGMKNPVHEIFDIENYGTSIVFENTIEQLEKLNLTYRTGETLLDIDTKEDLLTYATNFKNITLLGAGEYNINFLYDYNGNEKRVLRLNTKSQMNLEKQIAYEYNTLKLLECSGVTPKVYDKYEKNNILPYDYLTMEFLAGRPLNYDTDMKIGAYLLSKIHNTPYDENHNLIVATNPFNLMYEECSFMAGEYLSWDMGDIKVKEYLVKFLTTCEEMLEEDYLAENMCIINTELNSGNFLIGSNKESSYIIDWEKALLGECEQDLAHFLAPTTTFWKTDKILSQDEIKEFLKEYNIYRNYNELKFKKYFIFTCLRGITWCSMAFRQYSTEEKLLTDNATFNKIKNYLDYNFLEMLENYFNAEL